MVQIDKEKCIQCGQCVQDCVAGNLVLEEEGIKVKRECFLCGHCAAVCPAEAVRIPDYESDPVIPYRKESFELQTENLLNAIKFRRSIRSYKEKKIEPDKIMTLIDAGQHTATAKNTQGIKFVIVQEHLEELKELVYSGIEKNLEHIKEERNPFAWQMKSFLRNYRRGKEDFLFRNAPAVIYLLTENETDAGLAAQNIELVATTLGLGVLYNGYLKYMTEASREAMELIGANDRKIGVCMLAGYPAVKYYRTAPRREAQYEIL